MAVIELEIPHGWTGDRYLPVVVLTERTVSEDLWQASFDKYILDVGWNYLKCCYDCKMIVKGNWQEPVERVDLKFAVEVKTCNFRLSGRNLVYV